MRLPNLPGKAFDQGAEAQALASGLERPHQGLKPTLSFHMDGPPPPQSAMRRERRGCRRCDVADTPSWKACAGGTSARAATAVARPAADRQKCEA